MQLMGVDYFPGATSAHHRVRQPQPGDCEKLRLFTWFHSGNNAYARVIRAPIVTQINVIYHIYRV